MMRRFGTLFLCAGLTVLQACGPSGKTEKNVPAASSAFLYEEGHAYYIERNLDSAAAVLQRAVVIDSSSIPALTDLADVQYELGMRISRDDDPGRLAHFRSSRNCLMRLEALGNGESALYERLCELSVALADNRLFLKYAKKNAERFPFDRQLYNLGLAYYQTADYASAVRVTKEAADRFKISAFVAGFYRTMGLAYMKQDRDQTAMRMLETGLQAAESRIADLRKAGTDRSSPDFRRLAEDRVAILTTLRKLYTTYKEQQKLERVERLLRDAGQTK